MKVIDLSKRKPKNCPYCDCPDGIQEKIWDWLCGFCKRCWPKLDKGQLYLIKEK